jgi:hypothetical protein
MPVEIHVYKSGDEVRIEGKATVSELRADLVDLVKDLDKTVVGPRLRQLAEDLKSWLAK